MTASRVPRVIALTAATLAGAALLAAPAGARADDGRHEGRWKRKPRVVHVVPPPVVVVRPPVVVPARPAYVWIDGHYEAREQVRYVPGPPVSVWVPPQIGVRWADGRLVQVIISPGHYESRPGALVPVKEVVHVWVPGRWVPAARAVTYWPGRD